MLNCVTLPTCQTEEEEKPCDTFNRRQIALGVYDLALLLHVLLVLFVARRIKGERTGGPQMRCPTVSFRAVRKIAICEVQPRN